MAGTPGLTDNQLLDLIHQTVSASPTKQTQSADNSQVKHEPADNVNIKQESIDPDNKGAEPENVKVESEDKDTVTVSAIDATLTHSAQAGAGCHDDTTLTNSSLQGYHDDDDEDDDNDDDSDDVELDPFSLLSREELISSLHECRTELDFTEKKLEKSERQLKKSNDYNAVLRSMVEKVSSELHQVKHAKTSDAQVQVDKDDFLAYTTGKDTMPTWNPDSHLTTPMQVNSVTAVPAPIHTPIPVAVTAAAGVDQSLSIADSIKQAAESVVQQQQDDLLSQSGYVFDPATNLYYHAQTGYYYDSSTQLFYEPSTGVYYYYDYNTCQYIFHSQVEVQPPAPIAGNIPAQATTSNVSDHKTTQDKTVYKNRKMKRAALAEKLRNQEMPDTDDVRSSSKRRRHLALMNKDRVKRMTGAGRESRRRDQRRKDKSPRNKDKTHTSRDKDKSNRKKDNSDRDKDNSQLNKDKSNRNKDRSPRKKDNSTKDKDREDDDIQAEDDHSSKLPEDEHEDGEYSSDSNHSNTHSRSRSRSQSGEHSRKSSHSRNRKAKKKQRKEKRKKRKAHKHSRDKNDRRKSQSVDDDNECSRDDDNDGNHGDNNGHSDNNDGSHSDIVKDNSEADTLLPTQAHEDANNGDVDTDTSMADRKPNLVNLAGTSNARQTNLEHSAIANARQPNLGNLGTSNATQSNLENPGQTSNATKLLAEDYDIESENELCINEESDQEREVMDCTEQADDTGKQPAQSDESGVVVDDTKTEIRGNKSQNRSEIPVNKCPNRSETESEIPVSNSRNISEAHEGKQLEQSDGSGIFDKSEIPVNNSRNRSEIQVKIVGNRSEIQSEIEFNDCRNRSETNVDDGDRPELSVDEKSEDNFDKNIETNVGYNSEISGDRMSETHAVVKSEAIDENGAGYSKISIDCNTKSIEKLEFMETDDVTKSETENVIQSTGEGSHNIANEQNQSDPGQRSSRRSDSDSHKAHKHSSKKSRKKSKKRRKKSRANKSDSDDSSDSSDGENKSCRKKSKKSHNKSSKKHRKKSNPDNQVRNSDIYISSENSDCEIEPYVNKKRKGVHRREKDARNSKVIVVDTSDGEIIDVESGECSESDNEYSRGVISVSDSDSSSSWSSGCYSDGGTAGEVQMETQVEITNEPQYYTEGYVRPADIASSWPPCIRMIVTESTCLPVGTLYMVTCTGSTVGRDKSDISIKDINVSKSHAEIRYNESSSQYEVVDIGSQNGTFVNDVRISKPKQRSVAVALTHGSTVMFGETRFLCHIHAGTDTCDECEPGIVMANNPPVKEQKERILSKEEKKQFQRQQMNQLKRKYGLQNAPYVENAAVFNKAEYEDKAEIRRKTVGSDTPGLQHKHAPASTTKPISKQNIGHKMLAKMGWKEGDTLGKNNSGLQEPINVTLRANQAAGLGSVSAGHFTADDANTADMRKAARRVQAQQRFKKIDAGATGDASTTVTQTQHQIWTQGDTINNDT